MSGETKTQVELIQIIQVANEVMELLQRKTKSPSEAYLASKFITIYLESAYNLNMLPSEEKDLRDFVKEKLKEFEENKETRS